MHSLGKHSRMWEAQGQTTRQFWRRKHALLIRIPVPALLCWFIIQISVGTKRRLKKYAKSQCTEADDRKQRKIYHIFECLLLPKGSLIYLWLCQFCCFLSNLFLKNNTGNPLPSLGNLSWELGCISQVTRFAFHCNSSGKLPFTCWLVVAGLHRTPRDKRLCGLLPSRLFCPWVRAGAVREPLHWLVKDGCKLWVCMERFADVHSTDSVIALWQEL